MLNKQEAFNILTDTIRYGKTHPDYHRVVELAKKYKAMISGEGLTEYLKQFNLREDDELFKQRVRLTEYIVSCITGALITPEKKIPGVKPIKKEYFYKSSKGSDTKKTTLDELVKEFYGLHGVDDYLNDHFMNLSDSDPNAFILYLFHPFDPKKEKPKVYATAISSEEAIDFNYENNILQYLTVKTGVKYQNAGTGTSSENKATYSDGGRFNVYPGNDQIEFSQIDVKTFKTNLTENVLLDENFSQVDVNKTTIDKTYYYRFDKEILYEVKFYTPKAKQVPAFRVGNIPDIATDRRTRVNTWHRAMPYLMKSIKVCSELDLTFTLHAFPQKFEYTMRCMGTIVDKQRTSCHNGQTPDGNTCTACGGSGWDTSHKSAQEVIKIGLPKDPSEMFELSKLAYYLQLPIETVKTMIEYANMMESKAIKAVYSNDVVNQAQVTVATATEVLTQRQSVYDALAPLKNRYSYSWKFTITQIANYNDLEADLTVEHLMPSDLHFETVAEMIAIISAAKVAGVNDYVLTQMNSDLTGLIYVDQPQVLKEINVKADFNPFEGKSESVIMSILSNKDCTRYDRILWSNLKSIFIELEHETKNDKESKEPINFYDLTYTEQKKRVDVKVQEKIEAIDAEIQVKTENTSSFFDVPPENKNGQPVAV